MRIILTRDAFQARGQTLKKGLKNCKINLPRSQALPGSAPGFNIAAPLVLKTNSAANLSFRWLRALSSVGSMRAAWQGA